MQGLAVLAPRARDAPTSLLGFNTSFTRLGRINRRSHLQSVSARRQCNYKNLTVYPCTCLISGCAGSLESGACDEGCSVGSPISLLSSSASPQSVFALNASSITSANFFPCLGGIFPTLELAPLDIAMQMTNGLVNTEKLKEFVPTVSSGKLMHGVWAFGRR